MSELRPIIKEAIAFRKVATVREWTEFYEDAKAAQERERRLVEVVRKQRDALIALAGVSGIEGRLPEQFTEPERRAFYLVKDSLTESAQILAEREKGK